MRMNDLTLPAEIQTMEDALRYITSMLVREQVHCEQGFSDPWDEALALLSAVVALPVEWFSPVMRAALTASEKKALATLLHQRVVDRVPMAYLTGHIVFAGLPLEVTPDVLIPRSPLAEWIEKGFSPWADIDTFSRVADIGTGSGALALAMAFHWELQVDAVDISKAALKVAKRNIKELGLEDWVHAIHGDALSALPKKARYDAILSNPPYVKREHYEALPPEYHAEPQVALVAADDGLAMIESLIRGAANHLQPHGLLVLEVGEAQDLLEARYPDAPWVWLDCERGGEGIVLIDAKSLEYFHER